MQQLAELARKDMDILQLKKTTRKDHVLGSPSRSASHALLQPTTAPVESVRASSVGPMKCNHKRILSTAPSTSVAGLLTIGVEIRRAAGSRATDGIRDSDRNIETVDDRY